MFEGADLLWQVGQTVGWDFILTLVFLYQLFMPDTLHPRGSTKLKKEMRKPNESVIAALEAVYERHDELSRERLLELLNGDIPRAWQFEEYEEIQERPGGD